MGIIIGVFATILIAAATIATADATALSRFDKAKKIIEKNKNSHKTAQEIIKKFRDRENSGGDSDNGCGLMCGGGNEPGGSGGGTGDNDGVGGGSGDDDDGPDHSSSKVW